MNHLREIVEAINKENGKMMTMAPGMSADQYMSCAKVSVIDAEESVCFFAGDGDEWDGAFTEGCGEKLFLPFPKIYVEFFVDAVNVCILVSHFDDEDFGTDFGGGLKYTFFVRKDSVWAFLGFALTDYFGENWAQGAVPDSHIDFVAGGVWRVLDLLSVMMCCNIGQRLVPQSEKLNKARAKKGKKPFFSYWTLEIKPYEKQSRATDLGGSHASPRLHKRRGHKAQSRRTGKSWFVRAHMVGSKALGMIHKDYLVNP